LQHAVKYGVIGAGATGKSLIGHLPGQARELGPVAAVSFRVASRIANALRAGWPVRSADALNSASAILFHAPPDQTAGLLAILGSARLDWRGKALIFCDCEVNAGGRTDLRHKGASTAVIRQFGIAGCIAIDGEGRALKEARHIARALRLKPVAISAGAGNLFDAALTLGTSALTPLIDRTAALLRDAGVRDKDAAHLAASLFQQTAREYAHSGRQSWSWYLQKPDVEKLGAQIEACGGNVGPLMAGLLLLGCESFDRHPAVARWLASGLSK
jgi:hypothetical protein